MGINSLGLRIEKDRIVVSSRDVARAFEREHRNVLRDIRDLNCSEEFRLLNFEQSSYANAQNKIQPECLIARDGFVLLVMGYTGEAAMRFKEAYIREFNRMEKELRDRASLSVPRTLKEALLLAARLEGERESLEARNKEMAPKAEFYDAVAESPTAIDLGRVAKMLNFIGIGRNNLMEFLRRSRILMPDNIPYQEYVDRGYFKVIEQRYESDGETHVSTKTVAYQAGVNFMRKRLTAAGYEPYEKTRQLALFPDDEFVE